MLLQVHPRNENTIVTHCPTARQAHVRALHAPQGHRSWARRRHPHAALPRGGAGKDIPEDKEVEGPTQRARMSRCLHHLLLIGDFIISSALSKMNIDRVLITRVLSPAGTRPSTVLLAFIRVSCFASMWISADISKTCFLP
ncbi:hypothetical protein C8F04DRAFT_1265250 [Mycena alexandri]|uniref:Uncharacterized protein n=1 Tax=Mycena alexandri TaxID=1745969 RepID=A0AAD6SLK7_9AGAR|nr:hypothetical protein C8F04DRAFT_1265250 [Mycena alexandri]